MTSLSFGEGEGTQKEIVFLPLTFQNFFIPIYKVQVDKKRKTDLRRLYLI